MFDGQLFHFFQNMAGYPITSARGINNFGDIAGFYTDGALEWGYLLPAGAGFELVLDNVAPGAVTALGLNDQRRVVGDFIDTSGADHGYSWTDASHYTQIDPPFSVAATARGINNGGQIVGKYKDSAYALVTTSKSCKAMSLSGGAYFDSYDSAVASYEGTPSPGAGADVATNGGATLSSAEVSFLSIKNAPSGRVADPKASSKSVCVQVLNWDSDTETLELACGRPSMAMLPFVAVTNANVCTQPEGSELKKAASAVRPLNLKWNVCPDAAAEREGRARAAQKRVAGRRYFLRAFMVYFLSGEAVIPPGDARLRAASQRQGTQVVSTLRRCLGGFMWTLRRD
jgi:hypothetical protein